MKHLNTKQGILQKLEETGEAVIMECDTSFTHYEMTVENNHYYLKNKGYDVGCIWNITELPFIGSLDEALSWAGDF